MQRKPLLTCREPCSTCSLRYCRVSAVPLILHKSRRRSKEAKSTKKHSSVHVCFSKLCRSTPLWTKALKPLEAFQEGNLAKTTLEYLLYSFFSPPLHSPSSPSFSSPKFTLLPLYSHHPLPSDSTFTAYSCAFVLLLASMLSLFLLIPVLYLYAYVQSFMLIERAYYSCIGSHVYFCKTRNRRLRMPA